MTIRTFSSTHDFHPIVLADTDAYQEGNADEIIKDIDNGRCPRCRGRYRHHLSCQQDRSSPKALTATPIRPGHDTLLGRPTLACDYLDLGVSI